MAGRYKAPGLTKEEKIKTILAIKQGFIDPKEIKENPQLDLTGIPESGLSNQEIEGNGGIGFLYNEYQDRYGKVFKLEDLPPLVPILFIFYAWLTEIDGIDIVTEIGFSHEGETQVIRHLLGTLNIEL